MQGAAGWRQAARRAGGQVQRWPWRSGAGPAVRAAPGAAGWADGDFVQQMLERMPAVTVGELKPGTLILVSSTAGADPTRLTAIQLVSNIEPVVQMMAR